MEESLRLLNSFYDVEESGKRLKTFFSGTVSRYIIFISLKNPLFILHFPFVDSSSVLKEVEESNSLHSGGTIDGALSALRLAEEVAFRSQLLTSGFPSVYLLNVNKKSSDLRWFEFGKANGTQSDHKVVILMGAAGRQEARAL